MLDGIVSWVARTLGIGPSAPVFVKKTWADFADLPAENYARAIAAEEMVDLAQWRREERMQACNGTDPLKVIAAYAQDSLAYTPYGQMTAMDEETYAVMPPADRVNKFRQAYKNGSSVWLHKHLADITVDAAIDLRNNQGWTTVAFDGLRTMESAYLLYHSAKPEWLREGLLSTPGKSAHNRALAVDSMMFDADGREVDMGGHFDHADMESNHRNYQGARLSAQGHENRLIRERAFMRAALRHGTAIAPLREEFWDDRVPGSEKDLWRVIESVCRCIGQPPPEARAADYPTFARQWETYLNKKKLAAVFGDYALHPPLPQAILYHENLKPIYDRDLPEPMQQTLIEPALLAPPPPAHPAPAGLSPGRGGR